MDLSRKGNNATLHGCEVTEDGIKFDGIDDYADLGLQNYGNFTIEVIFNMPEIKATLQAIIGNWENGGGGIFVDNASVLKSNTYINGSYKYSSYNNFNVNQKTKVTLACNGKEHKLYVNGNLAQNTTVDNGLVEVPNFNTIMMIRRKSRKEYFKK